MTAVKQTAEACRQGQKLLESILVRADVRDVFKNAEYSSQLKRLSGAVLKDGKRQVPERHLGVRWQLLLLFANAYCCYSL